MQNRINKRHVLFVGELSDIPGRMESWIESVRYLGRNRWELLVEGTDFSGRDDGDIQKEIMGTKSLIQWVLNADALDEEGKSHEHDDEDGDDESLEHAPLSGRAKTLMDIAHEERAEYLINCLNGWTAGTWPPRKKIPIPKLLDVTGVCRRGIWLGVYRPAFAVQTSKGHGYLSKPDDNRFANLLLWSDSSNTSGQKVRVSKILMQKINRFSEEFESLKESLCRPVSKVR